MDKSTLREILSGFGKIVDLNTDDLEKTGVAIVTFTTSAAVEKLSRQSKVFAFEIGRGDWLQHRRQPAGRLHLSEN